MFHYMYQNQRLRFACLLLLSIINCVFEVGLAYVMLQCVNLATSGNLSQAPKFIAFLIFYIVIYFIVDYFAKKTKWQVLKNAQINLRDDVSKQIFSMPIKDFHKKNTGGWLATLTNQLNMIEESYFMLWFGVFTDIFEFTVSLVFLFIISPLLTLFVFAVTGIQMLIPKIMSPKIADKKKDQAAVAEEFSVIASEHLNGFDLLRSFQLTAKSLHAISTSNKHWEESKYRVRIITTISRILSFTLGEILYVGIYFFGALLTLLGQMTVGSMIAASQLVVYIASPLQMLSDNMTDIRSAKEIIQKLEDDIRTEKRKKKNIEKLPVKFDAINFENVSFSYEEKKVIDKATFSIKSGGKYLLCGPSGAGKSTLVELITGVLYPDEGEISVDGINIDAFSLDEYARFILQCSQNIFVFNASLRDNVTLFNEDFTDEQVEKALQMVGFSSVMERFDDGLEHIISQGGQEISGGERQRIALARMELYSSPVVIFDESFANIDAESAKSLIENFTSNPKRTVILIEHKLPDEIAAYFDKKITVNKGQISVEE